MLDERLLDMLLEERLLEERLLEERLLEERLEERLLEERLLKDNMFEDWLLEERLLGVRDGGRERVLTFTVIGPFICSGTFCVTDFKNSFIDSRSIIDNNTYAATLDSKWPIFSPLCNFTEELNANIFNCPEVLSL